ncbi:MAG: substrate-binding domain-containing protein [bacterium]|nr:substrate-binding domain-containing protein [bacterium]
MAKDEKSNRLDLKRVFKTDHIIADIKEKIKTGELLPGDPLISERTLAQNYNVSLISVRRALAKLEEEGLIEKKWGLGNFVRGTTNGKNDIGVIVPHLRNPIFVEFLRQIIFQAGEIGYHVVVADADNKIEREEMFIQSFAERGIKNVLKFPNILSKEEEIREKLVELGMKFVIINDFWTDLPSTQVKVDEVYGASLMMEHLFSKGYHSIAYIDDSNELRKRIFNTYRYFLEKNKVFNEDLVFLGAPEGPAISHGVQFLLEKKNIIAACFTPYDCFAIYYLENLVQNYGYRIPQDLAIAGFDDTPEAAKPDVLLTTIRQPKEKIVSASLKLLLGIDEIQKDKSIIIEIKPELVVRKSTDPDFVQDHEEKKQTLQNLERRWVL